MPVHVPDQIASRPRVRGWSVATLLVALSLGLALGLTPTAGVASAGAAPDRLVSGGAQRPVLGSADYAPYSEGFGTARPRAISNGGVPSGTASDLRWSRWGQKRAYAVGKTPLYRPDGGYYARPGKIRIRAQRLGTCADGTYGYTRMRVRVAERPGGPLGKTWYAWGGGNGDICSYLN